MGVIGGGAFLLLLTAAVVLFDLPLPVALAVSTIPGVVTGAIVVARIDVLERQRVVHHQIQTEKAARSLNRAFTSDLRWAKTPIDLPGIAYRNRSLPHPYTVMAHDGRTGSPAFDAIYRFQYGLRHADDIRYVHEIAMGHYRPLSIFLVPIGIVHRASGHSVARVWDGACWCIGEKNEQLAISDMYALWNGMLADLETRLYHGRPLYM